MGRIVKIGMKDVKDVIVCPVGYGKISSEKHVLILKNKIKDDFYFATFYSSNSFYSWYMNLTNTIYFSHCFNKLGKGKLSTYSLDVNEVQFYGIANICMDLLKKTVMSAFPCTFHEEHNFDVYDRENDSFIWKIPR